MTKLQVRGWCASVLGRRWAGDIDIKLDLSEMAIVFVFCVATAIASHGQTFNTLVTFHGPNGGEPYFESLVQGTDGNLYGTTAIQGVNGNGGTVFKVSVAGVLTTIYNFCSLPSCADGGYSVSGLLQATNGAFYGTTLGGSNGYGSIFEINAAGQFSTLYSFSGPDGEWPYGTLVEGSNGNFYGTTFRGGPYGDGTVFEVTPAGKLTTLHSFDGTDGSQIYAGLVQANNGNFYGTTDTGGASDLGTIFEITPSGKFTTLHTFAGPDGAFPYAPLLQASNGYLYGTTEAGGAAHYGTVFKITAAGTLTTLYSFCPLTGCLDGANPEAGLVQASDGNFYGTTFSGGAYVSTLCPIGCGTVFKLTPVGKLTSLHSFCRQSGCPDGELVYGGLVQATDGVFYGVNFAGGDLTCDHPQGCGTIFSLSVGLRPFVEAQPTAGKVGSNVIILGTNLTGTTAVTFNGTAASFTVVSSSEITTSVPAGASTGRVTVTTPSAVLKSNRPFRVIP
jgi:uncharacterized repeat protein (TIGR03803 family)